MRKVLIINRGVFSPNKILSENYEISSISFFKKIPFLLKPIRILHTRFNLPGTKIWEKNKIDDHIKGYNLIVLHDSANVNQLQRFINLIDKYAESGTKCFFYYWNSINSLLNLQFSSKWEIISFDYKDSLRFNIRYVGGYYIPEIKIAEQNAENTNDVFFIGIDKGRFSRLIQLEKNLNKAGLKTSFVYVSKIKSLVFNKYSKPLPYSEVVKLIQRTKSILDISKSNQFGLTLRVYESIFYQKKLITYNSSIREYDFYNPKNMLILNGDADTCIISDFLSNTEEIKYENLYKERYSLNAWIQRVETGNSLSDVVIGK